jgi:hypothetical protein
MVDVIFAYVSIAIALIAGIVLYILLISRVLPKILLSPLAGAALSDRGVKKSTFPGGRSIAYEPSLGSRIYVSQYVLYSENVDKYIKCKVNERVHSVKYDLTLYDRKNKAFDRIEVFQTAENGYTSAVMLPSDTSFVHMNICDVNETPVKEKEPEVYSMAKALCFFASVFALTFILGLIINCVVISVSDEFLGYFDCVSNIEAFPMIAGIFVISLLMAIFALMFNVSKPSKFVWKIEKSEK